MIDPALRLELMQRRGAPQEAPRRRPPLKPEPGVYDEGKAQRVSPYPPERKFGSWFRLPKRQGF